MISSLAVISTDLIFKNGYFIMNNLITTFTYLKTLNHGDYELNDLITENDITEDLNIINSFLEEIQVKNHSKTVGLCIQNLADTLQKIEQTLLTITSKIENHNRLWFHSFRSYDIQKEKIIFPKLVHQMNHRFHILRMVTSVLS
jgi:hypothetical protein